MHKYGLVVIGAYSGAWLTSLFEEYQNQSILLVEPVPYNIDLLKKNTYQYKNIKIETSAVSEINEIKKFYFVRSDSINKLGKHWASGIGSFNKQHILNHKNKRFLVSDADIEDINIQYITFADLIKKYSIISIDLLQIDVEGAEMKVLKQLNFEIYDPEIICVEILGCRHISNLQDREREIKNDEIYKFLVEKNYKKVWSGSSFCSHLFIK